MDKILDPMLEELYSRLEAKIKENTAIKDMTRIRAAFEYAAESHGTQKRKDGSPFVSHPMAAAEIVAEMGLDEDSVIAALLHDCIEDTGATHEDIEK